jgi:hypothetical protein
MATVNSVTSTIQTVRLAAEAAYARQTKTTHFPIQHRIDHDQRQLTRATIHTMRARFKMSKTNQTSSDNYCHIRENCLLKHRHGCVSVPYTITYGIMDRPVKGQKVKGFKALTNGPLEVDSVVAQVSE